MLVHFPTMVKKVIRKTFLLWIIPDIRYLQWLKTWFCIYVVNPFIAEFSNVLHNASEKTSYQITHIIYLLETICKIVPYRLGKPKAFLH